MVLLAKRYVEDHPEALRLHSTTEFDITVRQGNRNTLLGQESGCRRIEDRPRRRGRLSPPRHGEKRWTEDDRCGDGVRLDEEASVGSSKAVGVRFQELQYCGSHQEG